ncbi:Putative major facilitator superfamily, MFS transporter superfamily [Septoria linicola]|uniref:Major facilitator superfamily, MFS transporter superfamily n=1 Tax=Septoria linicola TaxID=215465 RepID=A0A9Q9B3V4_9PEZI|nr:Putative major facilitator superfamily, MFS transporter superfamily [Septoria linicola]
MSAAMFRLKDGVHNLGSVRLRDSDGRRVLVPQPSSDPNDPLNWSRGYRYYQAVIVCLTMVMCNFLAAGPTVAIVETTIDFFGAGSDFTANLAKISFFFTATSLLQGLGNLAWMPLIVKWGRRPVYLASFTIYTATALWTGMARSYGNTLVARIFMGFAAGSGECLAPLTISDIFFLHERGTIMAAYTASLNFGVSIGIIVSGLVTMNLSYRYVYYVAAALIGLLTIVVFFTMPETSYARCTSHESSTLDEKPSAGITGAVVYPAEPARPSLKRTLRLYHGRLTDESIWTIFFRPIVMLALPPVLWATLVMSVTIGFLVAITSNFASAFQSVYGFADYQAGLCFIAGIIGSAFGMLFGGLASDWLADFSTRRNGGVRQPEFRLPAISIGLITALLALVLYGAGIESEWHWTVPKIALGLLSFSIAQTTNVSLVYIVDAYRPIAGETIVTQLAFKSAFGFLLSFYTNPWIDKAGYKSAFAAMAGIAAAVLLCWIPLFIYGKRVRHASLRWPLIAKYVQWDQDREVGE